MGRDGYYLSGFVKVSLISFHWAYKYPHLLLYVVPFTHMLLISTLWLMEMKDEFWEARDWVKHSLDFNSVRKAVSVFETTIRNLGSLLSAYDVSGDRSFLEKADDLGTRLLRAFNTPSGVPFGEVELFDGGRAFNTDWHTNAAVLSEIG